MTSAAVAPRPSPPAAFGYQTRTHTHTHRQCIVIDGPHFDAVRTRFLVDFEDALDEKRRQKNGRDHLHVGQVSLDAAHHLGLFEHFLGVRRGLRLFAALDGGRGGCQVLVAAGVVHGAAGHARTRRQLVHGHHGRRRRLAAQLQHREEVVRRRAHQRQRSHLTQNADRYSFVLAGFNGGQSSRGSTLATPFFMQHLLLALEILLG